MGLYNSLAALLRRYDGVLSFDEICSFFEEEYSKSTILDFLTEHEETFKFDGELIASYQIKIDIFLEELKMLILKYRPSKKIIRNVVIESLLMFSEKHSFNKKFLPDYDIERTEDEFFEIDVDDKLKWLEEFFSTNEQKYQFTSQLIEFLIAEEFSESAIYTTPLTLIKLINALLPNKNNITLYNPTAGCLKLAIGLQIFSGSKLNISASEINKSIYNYGSVLSTINDAEVDFQCADSRHEITKLNNYQFDVIVSNLPFSVKTSKKNIVEGKYKELSMHIVSESIKKLNDEGRAIFVVNEGVLFSSNTEAVQFRKEIVESGMLKTIVSLPPNIMTRSAVKSSVLIFEKKQHSQDLQFIDAAAKEFYSLNPDKSISLNIEKISSSIKWSSAQSSFTLNEPTHLYGSTKNVVYASISDIKKHSYELNLGRYLADQKVFGKEYVALKDICSLSKTNAVKKDIQYPFIRITELNSNNLIKSDDIRYNTTKRRGEILNNPGFLIGTIEDSFKPSFFDGTFEIEVSSNVIALDFKKDKVYPPYLLQELNSDYVLQQMKILTKGSAIKSITRHDLLTVKVKLPSFEEQKRIYSERISYRDEHQLSLNKANKTISDAEVFKVFKHEIGNILKSPEGFFDLIPDFLQKNNVSLDTPIVENQSDTIGEMIDISTKKIGQIHWVMENMKGILLSDKKYFKPENTELKPFIETCLTNELQNSRIKWHIITDGSYTSKKKHFAEIDRGQFENLIRNMVVNAENHGNTDKSINLVVDISYFGNFSSEMEDTISIHFINDGKPLPENFNFEDYIQFGKKSGDSNGQGLGGFLINQVVQNHNGVLEIIPSGNNREIKKGKIIESNVNFSISIPKTQ